MCGIAGFTLRQTGASESSRAILDGMLAAIAYRGPDQSGVSINEQVAFGHNRLTIIEPQGGEQPRSADGRTLIYNGEIYEHRRFDADIAAAGHQLRDHCDTETLFWLIEMHGVQGAVKMLDGMFAFAYHDANADTLYLARDPFGQKPLFYAEAGGDLLFASEIKSLLRHPSLSAPEADIDALGLYLMMEYVPGNRTGIRGIYELPPGHILSFTNNGLSVDPYWRTSDIARQTSVDKRGAEQQFEQSMSNAVERQLVADVPVGIFLSGGLDSSFIAALARRHHTDVATFTIKFPQASFDESEHAETVAQYIGTRHTTIELGQQSCADGVHDLVAHVDQPFADSSFLPTYLLCKATREHVTVALGGDGADELLLGYPNFRMLRYARLLQSLPSSAGKAGEWIARRMPSSQGYMNAAFLLRQLSYGIGVPADMQSVYWMSAVAARDQNDLWIRDHTTQAHDDRLFEQVAEQVAAVGQASLMETCQQHFLNYYLPSDILQKTDRASMYSSLEVRAPFLSSGPANFALSLPISSLFKGAVGKRILRSVAKSYLPEATIARQKHGFALPVSSLLGGDLRDVVEPVLLDTGNPMYQYLDHNRVRVYWQQHMTKKGEHGKKLWALFMLAAFFNNALRGGGFHGSTDRFSTRD